MFAVLRLITLAAVATRFVAAAPALVTVTAPNFGGEPEATTVPAVIIGVDSAKSQTTYAVNQDETDGSSTIAFVTGTVVLSPDYFSYGVSHVSAAETLVVAVDCTISSGKGLCGTVGSDSQVATATVDLAPIVLDVTAAPASSGSAPISPTSSGASAGPSTTPNASQKISASFVGAVFMTVSLVYQLL